MSRVCLHADYLEVRTDVLLGFDNGLWAILPAVDLLRQILSDVKAHRSIPYAKRPHWLTVIAFSAPV